MKLNAAHDGLPSVSTRNQTTVAMGSPRRRAVDVVEGQRRTMMTARPTIMGRSSCVFGDDALNESWPRPDRDRRPSQRLSKISRHFMTMSGSRCPPRRAWRARRIHLVRLALEAKDVLMDRISPLRLPLVAEGERKADLLASGRGLRELGGLRRRDADLEGRCSRRPPRA